MEGTILRRGSYIVDELSRIETAIRELEKQRALLFDIVEEKHGLGYLAGDEFKAKINRETRAMLIPQLVVSEMGRDWAREHSRPYVVRTVKAEPLTAADIAALV